MKSTGGIEALAWPPVPTGPFAGAARAAADPRAGWSDAQRQEEARLDGAWQQANEAVLAAGRASSAAWAAFATRRVDAKAVRDAIARRCLWCMGRGGDRGARR